MKNLLGLGDKRKYLSARRQFLRSGVMAKDFPLYPLEKLARKAGAERVSASALKEMKVVVLEIGEKIAVEAVAACHHAKRVTVKREDIILATR